MVIAEQGRMIGELLRRVERLISRNSGNSSMPPSSDGLPGRRPPAGKPARKASNRKPGKQPEIPLASARVIQHDLHAVACGCG